MSDTGWKVVVTNVTPDRDLSYEQEALLPLGVELQRIYPRDDDELAALAADADVLLPMGRRVGSNVIQRLARCRVIPSRAVGVDSIDVTAATEHGILVTNMATVFIEEVANHAWMLLLLVARRGLLMYEMATTGQWAEAKALFQPVLKVSMPRVTGQTLGLVAFGNIARAVALRARAFGMSVVAFDPYLGSGVFAEHGVEQVAFDEVFRRADFVSCHLPLTPETLHAVGEAQFRAMKPTAVFLNTGRGKVVDEAALIAALQEGRIAGAGLDVLEQEPPDRANPLLRMANVAVTPHMASDSDVSVVERRRMLGHQIADVLQGRLPAGVVNREVLSRPNCRATFLLVR